MDLNRTNIRSSYYDIQDLPRISPCSVRMRENTDQKNSKYRHFLHSGKHDRIKDTKERLVSF